MFPLSLIIGDAITGFHPLIPFVCTSFLVSVAIGFGCAERSATRIGAATLAGVIQFFLVPTQCVGSSLVLIQQRQRSGCMLHRWHSVFWNTLAGDAFYVHAFRRGRPGKESSRLRGESLAVNKAKLISQSRHSANALVVSCAGHRLVASASCAIRRRNGRRFSPAQG